MTIIVVANPKGGVGKTTLAVNLAGCLARHGRHVALADLDIQESAQLWLSMRPRGSPRIAWWPLDRGRAMPPPPDTEDAVLDTPAGLSGALLEEVMARADHVLVPLQPSLFDLPATRHFVMNVLAQTRFRHARVAVVANRVREHTQATERLRHFLRGLGVPVLTELRDTQTYVQLAFQGLTLWDVPPTRVERDVAQWTPITDWIGLDRQAA